MRARYLVVDGHSVIFQWEALRQLHQKRTAAARDALVDQLQALQDASQWLVTVVFDSRVAGPDRPRAKSPQGRSDKRARAAASAIVVAYASVDETADLVIERLVAASGRAAEILVVTADHAEQATVLALGASVQSPDWLASEMNARQAELQARMRTLHARSKL